MAIQTFCYGAVGMYGDGTSTTCEIKSSTLPLYLWGNVPAFSASANVQIIDIVQAYVTNDATYTNPDVTAVLNGPMVEISLSAPISSIDSYGNPAFFQIVLNMVVIAS